jgi:hypothetical protein
MTNEEFRTFRQESKFEFVEEWLPGRADQQEQTQ